ncbi:MAG: phosphoglucomutase, partial [Saccharothrix sp.]|nr:phosphoglucomutase [Saccharothrix sp.]
LPTPTATAAVRRGDADIALLVTASHNPARWNGLKVKVAPGCPLPRELESEIDAHFQVRRLDVSPRDDFGAEPPDLLVDQHIAEVLARAGTAPRPLAVTVDGLGGVAGEPVARLCERLGWTVTRVACAPDPDFGGIVPDPSVPASRERAAGHRTDLAIVLDGDGDRVYLLDHRGRTVQPSELLALLLERREELGLPTAGVAVTASTGTAVRAVARRIGVPVHEVGVGFKHLSPLLATNSVDVAGGAVGDLSFTEFGLDRDPFAAIVLLAELLSTGSSLAALLDDLRARVGALSWFESKVDVEGADPRAAGLTALRACGLDPIEITEVDGTKFWLPGGQWLLLRASTTEVGVRVYVELGDEPATRALVRSVEEQLTNGINWGVIHD